MTFSDILLNPSLQEYIQPDLKMNQHFANNKIKYIMFRTTELAENKTYMKWNNYWDQLILNGFIPLLALVCFNIRWEALYFNTR